MAKDIRFTRFHISPIEESFDGNVHGWRIAGDGHGVSIVALFGEAHQDWDEVQGAIQTIVGKLNKRLWEQQGILGTTVDDDESNLCGRVE